MNILIVCLMLWSCFALCFSSSGIIAGQKCQEYARSVYAVEDSPVMLPNSSKTTVSQCGIVEVPLVVGGVNAQEKEFPHMAVLGYQSPSGDMEWKCGGTLISEDFVLTASHCIKEESALPVRVRLGTINIRANEASYHEDYDIEKTIKHPEYKGLSKYNDIALLKLKNSVKFNAYIRPACLNTVKKIPQKKAIATGFGKTSYYEEAGSSDLLKVTLDIIKNEECGSFFENEKKSGTLSSGITDTIICSGYLKGGKDTCQGDSGGPLQEVLANPYCMYNVIGVVSFGKYCGFANQPAIYTNVAHYIDWIEGIVWPK